MKERQIKIKRKQKRNSRIRSKILAKRILPRLTVFRSNKYIYAQIIDDQKGKTLVASSEKETTSDGNKTLKANALGKSLADKAKKRKINKVVFDRGSYKYHGRVKAFAEGAREGGLQF